MRLRMRFFYWHYIKSGKFRGGNNSIQQFDDVPDVWSKFVFAADIEVVLNANGRTYSVSEVDYLQQLFEEYAPEYF